MQEYLGVTPPTNAEGLMQDIHWSMGGMGYFPTYSLGNFLSAQLYAKVREDVPNLDDEIRQGNFPRACSAGWNRTSGATAAATSRKS